MAKALAACLKHRSQQNQYVLPDRTSSLNIAPHLSTNQSTEAGIAANLVLESLPPQENVAAVASLGDQTTIPKTASQVVVTATNENDVPCEMKNGESTTKPLNVLLVDDNEINLKAMGTLQLLVQNLTN